MLVSDLAKEIGQGIAILGIGVAILVLVGCFAGILRRDSDND